MQLNKVVDLVIPFPPSVNCLYRNASGKGKRPKSKRYLDWGKEAMPFALSFKVNHPDIIDIESRVATLYRHGTPDDKRVRDVENYSKAISDLLKDYRILKDDSLIRRSVCEWADDVEEGYTQVIITPLDWMKVSVL